jgi:hypothetical protein
MTQAERDRLVALKKAKKKLITQKQAAEELGITERHVRRLLGELKRRGDKAVMHALRGLPSNRKVDVETQRETITILSRPVYRGFGPMLASEYLARKHKIEVSRETVRQWMIEAKLWRARKQHVEKIHQWRPRRSRYGESPFLAHHLTLPQAVDTRAFPLSTFFSALPPSPPTPRSPVRTLLSYHHEVYVGIRFHCNVRPSRPVPKVTSPTAPDSKRIAASCQTREASFITPYRNHRGHACVVALLPISSRGRGASDTVRAIIGHMDITSGRRRRQAKRSVRRAVAAARPDHER